MPSDPNVVRDVVAVEVAEVVDVVVTVVTAALVVAVAVPPLKVVPPPQPNE